MSAILEPAAPSRIPLNTLAIPFGLVGYAGCWSAAQAAFGWAQWSIEVFWVIAAGALIWVVLAHTIGGRQAPESLGVQLRLPAQGPIAAIVPVSIMLFGAHVYSFGPAAGSVLVYSGAGLAVVFAAWLLTQWIRQPIAAESIHGGYFLPTVAAGFVAAETSAVIGDVALARMAFGLGAFFWIVIFTIVLARLILVAP